MNGFEKFLVLLDGKMTTPVSYGWFHIMFIFLCITATVLIAYFFRNATDKQNRIVLLVISLIMILFEIYKQLNFSFSYTDTSTSWSYRWFAFPYQFCSVPMYVALLASFFKKGKVQESLMSFLALYGVFGGLATLVYPEQVFVSTIGINIQTMVHHSLMIVLGVYAIVYNRKKFNLKFLFKGLVVLLIAIAIAMILNLSITPFIGDNTFNMFFISPYFPSTLPLISLLYPLVPYPIFLLLYIVGFALIGLLIFYICKLIFLIINKLKKPKAIKA